MNKEALIKLKKKILELSEDEKKQRDVYLKELADGTLQGPPVGIPSIDKPWLKYYDSQTILNSPEQKSIYNYMFDNNSLSMDGIAIEYFGQKITYAKLKEKVDKVAGILYHNYGIRQGDIVTLLLANIPENSILVYALNKIGAIANLVDLRIKDDALVHEINSVKSKIVFCTDLFIDNILQVKDRLATEKIIVTSPADSLPLAIKYLYYLKTSKLNKSKRYMLWDEFYSQRVNEKTGLVENNDSLACACILHTSGTTGNSKGVMLSSKAFNSMVYEYSHSGIEFEKKDRYFNQVPPFLAYNIVMATHLPLSLGMRIMMHPNYEPENFAKNLAKYKINHAIAGPADWSNFIEQEKINLKKYEHLKTLASGSDKMGEERKEKVKSILGKDIIEGYGCTEGSSAVVTNLPKAIRQNSVGIPLPLNNIGIFDETDGEYFEVPFNERGEICFTGPTSMLGYYNNLEETNNIMVKHDDGKVWIHTGDEGYIDKDGFLFFIGRIKRIIVRYDGQKVSPSKLENVVTTLENVKECCVISGNDLEHGNGSIPIIYVSLKDDIKGKETTDSIFAICKEKLVEKEQPYDVVIVDKLPLTPVGKVNYRLLEKTYNENQIKEIKQKGLKK